MAPNRESRIPRIVISAFCLAVCCWQIGSFLRIYFEYRTVVDVSVNRDSNQTRPAMSICLLNRIQKSFYESRFPKINVTITTKDELEAFEQNLAKILNITDFVQASIAPDKLISSYVVQRNDKAQGIVHIDVKKEATWIFNNDFSCWVLHAEYEKTSELEFKGFRRLYIDIDLNKHERLSEVYPPRVKYYIHQPSDIPFPEKQNIQVVIGRKYRFEVDTIVENLMEYPYVTSCQKYKGKDTGPLSMELCLVKCAWTQVHKTCGCIPENSILMNTTNKCVGEESDRCKKKIDFDKGMELCLPQCPRDCNKNGCMISIKFMERVTTFTHRPQFQFIETFSYIGGFVGIWLGLSVPKIYDTVVELFTHTKRKIRLKKIIVNKNILTFNRNNIKVGTSNKYVRSIS